MRALCPMAMGRERIVTNGGLSKPVRTSTMACVGGQCAAWRRVDDNAGFCGMVPLQPVSIDGDLFVNNAGLIVNADGKEVEG